MADGSLYYHSADVAPMLAAEARARRCGDGCFASARCGTSRRLRQACRHCPLPHACRNRTARGIERDQAAIRQQLRAPLWRPARLGTCAVVGSSASLLARRYGAEIDAHTVVVRVNTAPTKGFEELVGSRTDVRVWGASTPPRRLNAVAAIVPADPSKLNPMRHYANLIRDETVLRFCGPTPWLSSCWKNISRSEHADPRFHPSAWRVAARQIYANRTRCRRITCHPTSGAMAVLFALDRCEATTVYGYGVDGDGGAATPCRAAGTGAAPARCWKSRTCEKYYQCATQTLFDGPDQMPETRAEDAADEVAWEDHLTGYWVETASFHDVGQEWEWLARLHARRRVAWRGAPDPRAPSSNPCHRRRPQCWRDAKHARR